MSDLTSQGSLHLEVRDFGPIVKAEIDLRPLTVFVGPSNTGKSYLTILIYALHQHFSSRSPARIFQGGGQSGEAKAWSQPDIASFVKWATQLSTPRKRSASNRGNMNVDDPVSGIIRRAFKARCDNASNLLRDEIMRCFGIEESKGLIRRQSKIGARIVLRKNFSKDSGISKHETIIKNQKTECTATTPKGAPVQINADKARKHASEWLRMMKEVTGGKEHIPSRRSMLESMITSSFLDAAIPHLIGPLHHTAFYLPADRTGIMHAHKALVSAVIGTVSMRGLSSAPATPMLSGVLTDFLGQIINLGHPESFWRGIKSGPGAQIEKSMLAGSVNVRTEELTGYPRFTYRPNGWKKDLPLMNASSMVSELAPVVLYLHYLVQPGNVLIIEEPESHLHPGMQVEFIRQLARLVRWGVRVFVTTHSEWVLEELSNIVLRHKLPKRGQKDIAGDSNDDCALGPEQVGVWLFQEKQRPKGSVVTEVSLNDQSGIYPSGFERVAESLHNNWVDVKNRTRTRKSK